jgi:hypothetical protein
VKNEKVLHRVEEKSNILHTKTELRIEVTGRGEKISKQLLDDLKERKGCWK